MAEFLMPALGADMESGTLARWLVKEGDTVARGDIIAEVETQKGVIDVEYFGSGVVSRLLVGEGSHVPVGAPLAIITAPGEAAAPTSPAIQEPPVEPAPAPATVAAGPPARPMTHRARVTPVARQRATELGIDPATIAGTGPGGAVVLVDVERAAAAARPAERRVDVAAMRAAMGAAMARSKREIPHYYLTTEIDMRRALDWLATANAGRPVTERLIPAALLLKAVALACRKHPELNGFWRDGFERADTVNVSVGISVRGGGLVSPALHAVDELSLDEVMRSLLDLVNRTRSGHLRSSELSEGTITVTNLGDLGVTSVHGVIYPPQVALVGFGRIADRPWAIDGLLGVRPIVTATLSADHRASTGHQGGAFLAAIDDLLQHPEAL